MNRPTNSEQDLYGPVLRELGRVTIAYTFLDAITDGLLALLCANGSRKWKSTYPIGQKLDVLKKVGQELTDGPLRSKLAEWIQRARAVTAKRNDAIKSCMAYGDPSKFAGIIKIGGTGAELVDVEELRALVEELNQAAFEACSLHGKISESQAHQQ